VSNEFRCAGVVIAHQQNRKHVLCVGVGDGDGDAGGAAGGVDCVAGAEVGVVVVGGAAEVVTDEEAETEAVADRLAVADALGEAEELGDAVVADGRLEALSTSAGASDAETGLATGLLEADAEMVATLPTGAPALLPVPSEVGRVPKIRKATIAMPAQPPAILRPTPRRLRDRRPRWSPFAGSAAESSPTSSARCAEVRVARAARAFSAARVAERVPPRPPEFAVPTEPPPELLPEPPAVPAPRDPAASPPAPPWPACPPPLPAASPPRPRRPPPAPAASCPIRVGALSAARAREGVRTSGRRPGAAAVGPAPAPAPAPGPGCRVPATGGVHTPPFGSRCSGAATAGVPQPGQEKAPLRCLRQVLQ
jgi:hypothetical protein